MSVFFLVPTLSPSTFVKIFLSPPFLLENFLILYYQFPPISHKDLWVLRDYGLVPLKDRILVLIWYREILDLVSIGFSPFSCLLFLFFVCVHHPGFSYSLWLFIFLFAFPYSPFLWMKRFKNGQYFSSWWDTTILWSVIHFPRWILKV